MKEQALTVGAMAVEALKSPMTVREAFPTTVYLGSIHGMVVLTTLGQRSPFAINLDNNGLEISGALKPGQQATLRKDSLVVGDLKVDLRGAEIHNGLADLGFDAGDSFSKIERDLILCSFTLGLLYGTVDKKDFVLTQSRELRRFTKRVLVPFGANGASRLHEDSEYAQLLGLGSGFTPAGDDFLAGLLYIYNGLRVALNLIPLSIPESELSQRTVWASAMFLKYAQRGAVDEGLEAVLNAVRLGNGDGLMTSILALASRGHTSGIDVSLGMILTIGALHDHLKDKNLLERMLRNLRMC